VVAVVNTVEAWPITSFRLFSQVRTGETWSYQLVAIDREGRRIPVQLGDRGQVVSTTGHQLPELPRLSETERRRRVLAWLDLAGIEAATVERVELDRVHRRLDLHGGPAHELDRRTVVEVEL
jgi:hypothetical protein